MNPDLAAYLAQHAHCRQVSLVGPFARITGELPEPVIYVDRGTRYRREGEGISVGDGDSYEGTLDVRLDAKKDYSDLAFVLSAIPEEFAELHLLGFLGERRDHELFNLGEVHHFLKGRTTPAVVRFDQAVVGYSEGAWRFTHYGSFSVGVIEQTLVSMRGDCRYPCDQPTLFSPLSSLGLSNEANGTILIESTGCFFVFLHHDPV